MPPKHLNSKAAAAADRKSIAENHKKANAQASKDAAESQEWAKGAKDSSRKAAEEEKKKEAQRKKIEREALLAQEEKELGNKKPTMLKGAAKKALQKTDEIERFQKENKSIDEYSASGIDAALELLDVADADKNTASTDKLDRHPERRMKSAFAAFEERELPRIKSESPGLRLSQIKQALQKAWKKSPDNPMNQAHIAFDTLKSEEKEIIKAQKDLKLESFKS